MLVSLQAWSIQLGAQLKALNEKQKLEIMFGVDIQWFTLCCPPYISMLAVVVDLPLAFT